MGLSCRKNAFFQAPIKLAQPFPGPESRTKNFTDTRIFQTENSLANFSGRQISNKKLRIQALRRNSLVNANGLANEIAKISSSPRTFLANGRLHEPCELKLRDVIVVKWACS